MYKLFLTLRYLTRKKIVIFPILVVWLCLMMMIIVTSIMGGFVDRVRDTNRDLLGDIVVSNDTTAGWPYYEELEAGLLKKFPADIAAMTPVVRGYGLLNIPDYNVTFYVQVNGIDPVQRSKVSRFQPTLYHQYISPNDAVTDLAPFLPATTEELRKAAQKQVQVTQQKWEAATQRTSSLLPADFNDSEPLIEHGRPNWWWLIGVPILLLLVLLRLRRKTLRPRTIFDWFAVTTLSVVGVGVITMGLIWPVMFPRSFALAEDAQHQARLDNNRAWETSQWADALPKGATFKSRADLAAALIPPQASFALPPTVAAATAAANDDDDLDNAVMGCIVGAQTELFARDKRGNFDRRLDTGDLRALITVVPIREGGSLSSRPITGRFVIVDDSYTGVYDVDSTYVYAPFSRVQLMAGMRSDKKPDDPDWFPPRCSDLLIKLKGDGNANHTRELRALISDYIATFKQAHPSPLVTTLDAETWDEKQAKYLGAVENEKHMITFILGLMSLVVLVVVFLIFYMIVREKTRDIGIIKAVGGSEAGVAQIFLIYGLSVALVGGILGVISGVEFVLHTNQIHEWIYRMTGFIIWDRSVYLFDKIPDQVHPWEVALYFGLSLLAGVLGATLPALVAAAEDPVKAVRYE